MYGLVEDKEPEDDDCDDCDYTAEKYRIIDIDYKNIAFVTTKAIDQTQKSRGGHNIKKIMYLTLINCPK
jgi:hypothetical protein